MSEKLLSIKNLTILLNEHLVIDDISFELDRGDTIAIIGPNGAGKSVLFRAILGFIPYEGEIKWKKGVRVGYVPQKLHIERDIPLTTKEFFKIKEKNIQEIISMLSSVGFDVESVDDHHFKHHVLNNRVGNLSSGELQRVLIAWALIDKPDVLLFDEPTSGVDMSSEQTIYDLLYHLQKKHKTTLMIISHELQVVNKYANIVLCLNKQKICFGPPRKVLGKDVLDRLYGETMNIVEHSHTRQV